MNSLALAFAVNASEKPEDPTQKYRNTKAHEAIIHDSYYEAEKYTEEIPAVWKEALDAFGYKEGDIEFYTAVRTNKFVERVGNKLVILRPNFFLYCTPEEQKVYIALQLASLQQDAEMDLGGSHETFCNTTRAEMTFREATIGLTALGLIALYHKQMVEKYHQYEPAVKNILFSKAAALIGGCWLANKANELIKERDKNLKFKEAHFAVIDKLGAEGLLSIREKQVNWGKNNAWWWQRKWYYLLGKLSLVYNPEANLELIQNYIAKKEAQAIK
ncbi:MAG: hypothetical protein AMXMBFR12_08990 [Candidatus Babeliales bacterium]